jgi:nucleoside-diphosphate-sugar epimerase
MGAGTAGTTKIVLPALAQMGIPVEYTFTDLSPAFVAQARKRFKQYDFVKYRVHDIEKPAPEDLVATQHLVLASNAVHATHDLNQSTAHIKQFLRPDGVLLVLEMTSPVIFLDLIFGLFEGWWMFNDGRNHAVTSPATWDRCMKNVGYGHVAWTGGSRPETNIEKLIMGMAQAPPRYASLQSVASPSVPISHGSRAARSQPDEELPADLVDRKAVIEGYVRKYTAGWSQPTGRLASDGRRGRSARGTTVLVTGASGSLGSYLVAHLARLPEVSAVVCMNRVTKIAGYQRQVQVFQDRHIQLNEEEMQKVWVISTDTSLPQLGLSSDEYQGLMRRVTHICHNAWPMSAVRPVDGFQSQFQVMRNLIDLARDAGSHQGSKIGFEFVSSIAVVGQYPIWTEQRLVPEERMDVRSLIGNGYGDAKYICERMLDETLHRYPEHFHALSVRPGQIAGSKSSGAWNTHEHLSFLVKSCQTIKAVPAFEGELSWTPVEDVAGCCADLLMSEQAPHPIYHIDNPIRQPWRPMVNLWADALDIPSSNIVSFPRWLELVRAYQGKPVENPAIKLVDFLENEFIRMSCGGLLLDTQKSVSHSVTLSKVGPVSDEVARLYIDAWKQTGWLRA